MYGYRGRGEEKIETGGFSTTALMLSSLETSFLVDTETTSLHTAPGRPKPASVHTQWADPRVPLNFLGRILQGGKEESRP